MEVLRVYGKKNGEEKLIFAQLVDTEKCRATAKENAKRHGYEISRVIRIGSSRNGWKDEEIGKL